MSLIPVNIVVNGDTATEAFVQVTYELGTLNSICYITYFNAGGKQIGYTHQSVADLFDLPTQSALATLLLSQVNIQNLTRIILYSYELYSTYIVLKYYTDTPSFYKVFVGNTVPTSVSDSILGALFGVATPQARINGTSSILAQLRAKGFLVGSSIGTSQVIPTIVGVRLGASTINGTSIVTPSIKGFGLVHSSITGTSTVSGSGFAKGFMSDTISGTCTVTASVRGIGIVSTSISGTSTVNSTIRAIGFLNSPISGVSSVSGTLVNGATNTNTGNFEVTSDGVLVNVNVIPDTLTSGAAINEVLKAATPTASKGLSYVFFNNYQYL